MPFNLPLPGGAPQGWTARIYDNELPEEPHVTIRFKYRVWRVSIRTGEVLDRDPPPRELDDTVLGQVRANLERLATEWDRIHPHMPVKTPEPEDEPEPKPKKGKTKGSKKAEQSKGEKR